MVEEWLIDGYNLLHAVTSSKKSAPKSSAGGLLSKTSFYSALAGFAASKKQKIWLVLDGVGNPEELKIHQAAYFEAVYSQKVSADNYIEKYIYQNKGAKAFWVVTNDRTITELARGGGARVLKNESFLEMLSQDRSEGRAALDKEEIRSHGFNRPFDEKLKAKGL